jgi:hypothetical protein
MGRFLIIFSLFAFININCIYSQNTVGLLSYDPMQSYDGYNLMFPHNQPNVYLIDNCGEIAHVWEDDANWRPGNTVYLTEEGLLYKAKRDAVVSGDAIWAGGGGAILEIRDWDNNLVWQFEMNNDSLRLHHDFSIMPNGNIIALAWELKTTDECIAAGRDTSTLAQGKLWPDWVFEIDPSTDEILWEWHSWDHLIQDFDATKENFGVIADHPELIDVNYGRPDGHPDWHHGNALDYNAELDQIMLSIPYFDEIWIIDHTTTTEEAASHTGGFSGIGGDLMYRWGNPRTYENGDSADQKLFFQHDAQWVDDFLEFGHPNFGKIAVFNNRVAADYSAVNTFFPPWDMYKWRYQKDGNVFFPNEFADTITHPVKTSLWSTGLSSIQFLANGNSLITSGRFGYTFELTPDNEIVWEYKTPLMGGNPVAQGTELSVNNNLTFRMKRYPADFPAFDGKDLSGKGWIELEPDSTFCDQITAIEELMDEKAFQIFPNPVDGLLTIEWDGIHHADIEIHNLMGHRVAQYPTCSGGRKYLQTALWQKGLYFISIKTGYMMYTKKVLVQK